MTPTLAAIRFGTGLAPEISPPADGAEVLARLAGPDEAAARIPIDGWEAAVARALRFRALRRARDESGGKAPFRRLRDRLNAEYHRDLARTLIRAAVTRDGMRERLHWFWADHFSVVDANGIRRRTITAYHEDAIRPHMTGRFADLLHAAVAHPAMLNFLDQDRSAGPNSPRGRNGGVGLNENLAREVLELHTLGIGAPYGQTDIRELAELLTGLGVDRKGAFAFRPRFVEPGAEVVLGRSYGGARPNRHAIRAVLDDLAVHPATARHVSRKLATHFVADTPEPSMIDAMIEVWRCSDGDLMKVYAAMLDHPDAASPELRKVRRPIDFMAAALRVSGAGAALIEARPQVLSDRLTTPLARMGQVWLRPPGPHGWPEEADAWITPHGLAARLEWIAQWVGGLDPAPDPRDFVDVALGDLAGPRTRFAAQAAEDRQAGLGLILSAPEFQRR
ncbi:hypothetical protein JSE7799_00008 [Jannaschia seosinensis]|uniref:DUF1800 domain-containing protein n=1 Tax=Jannaschia seosinensis TaxID=313367 RepID=A0A0M7B5L1_9RHOB|nr:DUF1800 domain-containing protein [Jannaschia seosinensis]CUH07158.1 hypothetical protein JSE7799_00008 [Jannaschia seosinensis]